MVSTIYIIFSVLVYFLDISPMYKSHKDHKETQKFNDGHYTGSKRKDVLHKIEYYLATANLFVCFVLLLLKCFGLLAWW